MVLLNAGDGPLAAAVERLDHVPDLVERIGHAVLLFADQTVETHADDLAFALGREVEHLELRDREGLIGRQVVRGDLTATCRDSDLGQLLRRRVEPEPLGMWDRILKVVGIQAEVSAKPILEKAFNQQSFQYDYFEDYVNRYLAFAVKSFSQSPYISFEKSLICRKKE
mgnify:CR=1 FL=1